MSHFDRKCILLYKKKTNLTRKDDLWRNFKIYSNPVFGMFCLLKHYENWVTGYQVETSLTITSCKRRRSCSCPDWDGLTFTCKKIRWRTSGTEENRTEWTSQENFGDDYCRKVRYIISPLPLWTLYFRTDLKVYRVTSSVVTKLDSSPNGLGPPTDRVK